MPNIKSQKDRVLQSKKENLRNKAVKSNLKTVIKKADIALADGSADAQMAVVEAVSTIDKARSKGVLHKNRGVLPPLGQTTCHILKKYKEILAFFLFVRYNVKE